TRRSWFLRSARLSDHRAGGLDRFGSLAGEALVHGMYDALERFGFDPDIARERMLERADHQNAEHEHRGHEDRHEILRDGDARTEREHERDRHEAAADQQS